MSSIDEKRVYSATEDATEVFLATGVGVARVECSGGLVGEFGLVHRCVARDIASERLAVATDEDVLVWNRSGFDSTGFGPATTVGSHDGLIAAGTKRIAKYAGNEREWHTLGDARDRGIDVDVDVDVDVRAIDGGLLAAASGVYRFSGSDENEIEPVGLNDARDVSTATVPLVATADGLYQLKNGWVNVLNGDVHLVESDGRRTHAATNEGLYVRTDDEWEQVELPVERRITGIGYGESTYAVTVDGDFLLESEIGDGWHTRSLGLPAVSGLVVKSSERKPV